MPDFRNKVTGVVVSCSESTATNLSGVWVPVRTNDESEPEKPVRRGVRPRKQSDSDTVK